MKRFAKIVTSSLVIAIALGFSGCASSMITRLPKDISKTISDKEKAYITFSRPAFVGAALTNTIIEFNPKSKETKLVGILGSQNKLIYPTKPGTHYFYMEGGENDDMIKVSVDKNKMYYIETELGFGIVAGRFYFKPYKYSIEKKLTNIKNAKCNKSFLTKNNFTKVYEENEPLVSFGDKYESDTLNITIECSNNIVQKVTRESGFLIDDLKEVDLVKVNQKGYKHYKNNINSYLSEINEDYPEWSKKDYLKNELKNKDGFPLNR